ncbi:MAG: sulfatase-like hydrolase/transferase [Terriglobales bacterium]
MSRNSVLICVLWLAGYATAAPPISAKSASVPPKAAPPNVLLITLDTIRADRMGFLGSTLKLTPNLDALASESAVFTRAYAQVPLTTASHATILTGTYPQFHKVDDFGIPLAKDLPYAPDILRKRGYHTAAFVGSIILDPAAATAPGFDRGFDTYDAGFRRGAPGDDRYQTIERRADEVVAHALAWLQEHPQGPYFVWVHLYDAHDPYDPPEPYKSRYAAAPYDGEVAYVDSAVGKLLRQLRTRGLYENTLIAVMADHGESLGAHGEDTHGVFLYDETIRVPLLFKLPKTSLAEKHVAGKNSSEKNSTGKEIENQVGLVDVLPTILETTGVPIPQAVQGVSLLKMMKPAPVETETGKPVEPSSDQPGSQPVYAISDYPHRAFGWSALQAWRSGKYLYIDAPRQELYDQSIDPQAAHNLSATSSAVSETLAERLREFRQKTTSNLELPTAIENPELQEKLAALGYVGSNGSSAPHSGAKDTGADPKDTIEIANLFHQGALLIEVRRYDEAIPLLELVVAKEPDSATAYRQLGESYMALRNYVQAAAAARKAVELRPEWAIPHFLLGKALAANQDYKAATPEFEIVVAQAPRWIQAHLTLGAAYLRTNQLPQAIKEYETVIELDPDYVQAYLLIGGILTSTGDFPGALVKLTKAAELDTEAPEPHQFLADLYDRMGRIADARRERNESETLAANAAAQALGAPLPNVVLVTLDTTRADRMGFLGSNRGLTPNLDALAKQSAVFTNAYAQAPLTPTSHATILTGTYPQFHQVLDFPLPLADDLPYAPDILRAHGYRTGAFVGSLALDPAIMAPGLDRGFDTYDAKFNPTGFSEKTRYQTVERRGDEVVEHALAWLNKQPKGPFFLWVHLYDPHDPYDPPEPYKTRYASEPYDGEIAYVDSVVGKLMTQLKTRKLYDNSVIAVMADHGESLGAHGEDTHGIFLYDETIRVPLVIKLPGASPTGKRIEERVELVDVLPTLLQTARLKVPSTVQGKSMLGIMTAGAEGSEDASVWHNRPAYAQGDYSNLSYGWSAIQSLRTGKYLYIHAPRPELYDQAADPDADHDLSLSSTAVTSTLGAQLNDFRQKTSSKREAPRTVADPAEQAKLAALGYVATGSNPSMPGSSEQQADPKDKIPVADMIRRAEVILEAKHFAEAVPLLRLLITAEPNMALLYQKLGECYIMLHQYDKGLEVFRKALELNPGLPGGHLALARALMQVHDFAGAATELEAVIVNTPDLVDAHLLLEEAYGNASRVPETIRECQKVLKFLPGNYESQLTLGEFLARSGDTDGAVLNLKKAIALQPNAPAPHVSLADVYEKLGQKTDADRERAEAAHLSKKIEKESPGPSL